MEENFSSPQKKHFHNTSAANPRLARYKIEVKKLSRRLNDYADRELGEVEILRLLQDTRSKVIDLHVARTQLKQKKNRPSRRPGTNRRNR